MAGAGVRAASAVLSVHLVLRPTGNSRDRADDDGRGPRNWRRKADFGVAGPGSTPGSSESVNHVLARLLAPAAPANAIRGREKRASDEFISALSQHVAASIDKAIARCSANGRSTLRPEDI